MGSDMYEIRTSTRDDWADISRLMYEAFHDDLDEAAAEVEGGIFEPDRSVVATRDGVIVGHSTATTRDMSIPGGTIAAAHVTGVSVGATHRRQGLLTTMLTEVHAGAVARNEAIAVLWASEGKIYQRYGYGLAAQKLAISGRSSEIAWREPLTTDGGRLRPLPIAGAEETFGPVFDAVRTERTGWSSRNAAHWTYTLYDGSNRRNGNSALRAVVHEDVHGTVDGYMVWRVKGDWNDAGPNGTVSVQELIAATPAAYTALWQLVFSMDLSRNFRASYLAVDEPLQFLVTEPRQLGARLTDALWVRILDLPAALSARCYAAAIDVVIEVADARVPANDGRWHLVGSPDHAICKPTDTPADLALDVQSIGSAYLGGISLASLAAAGMVRELHPGTLAGASIGFGWHRPPSAIEIF